MNFFGIGLPEIVLILIIAIIVVGPQRLPEVAVQLARAIRYLRGYATDVTAQMRAELEELTREYQQIRQELEEFRRSATADIASVTETVDRTLREEQPIIEPSGEPPPEKRPGKPSGQSEAEP